MGGMGCEKQQWTGRKRRAAAGAARAPVAAYGASRGFGETFCRHLQLQLPLNREPGSY